MFYVWVDPSQLQCCGDPFGPGDIVRWTLAHHSEEMSLPDEAGVRIEVHLTHREEHYGELPHEAPLTVGLVRRVHAPFFEYVEGSNPLRAIIPKPGSGRVWEREASVDGWEREAPVSGARLRFGGYIIDLEPHDDGD